jgi:hypothetical protein
MQEALEAVTAQAGMLTENFGRDIPLIGLRANPFLFSVAELLCGRLLLEHATVAERKLAGTAPEHPDRAFYRGKIASARFYINTIVPQLFSRKRMMEIQDTSALEMGHDEF